jgi:hypothetical protein
MHKSSEGIRVRNVNRITIVPEIDPPPWLSPVIRISFEGVACRAAAGAVGWDAASD